MIDLRPVLQIVGMVLCVLAAFMAVPAAADALAGDEEWMVFIASGGVTLFIGLSLVLGARAPLRELTIRQTYLTGALGWTLPCFFAALPLAFGPAHLSAVDAFFEATSGLTTTGSTVIAGLDRMPPGLLLWRGLLNWLGGLGFIVMAVAVLPRLHIGGMQIFRIEVLSAGDRATARAARIGTTIVTLYVGLTAFLALLLWLAGLSGLDALVHAMSTVSTGGFGTYDTSLAHFDKAAVDLIVFAGMVVSGMPFLLFAQIVHGHWNRASMDQQLRWYFGLMALGAVSLSLWLLISQGYEPLTAIRHGFFTVASVLTGTGLTTDDYSAWTGLPAAILFFLTFVGGCAGSSSSGIKVFRLHLLFTNARLQIRRLLRPHAVMIPTFNDKPVSEEVLESVMGFLFVYLLGFASLAMMLGMMGLDFISCISGAASALANLAVGLGETIGPGTTYAPLPDAAKVLLAGGMVFGRLEMFILAVLFVPGFWKQ